jgi:hypothetical protein
MDSSSIQLPGSQIAGVSFIGGTLRVHFARAYIIKTMTGSDEKTLWWQTGALVLDDAELLEPLPAQLTDPDNESGTEEPRECDGGDIEENVYTYRDMIPVPLQSRGHCGCDLALRGISGRIKAHGTSIRLEMQDTPHYIEHTRA